MVSYCLVDAGCEFELYASDITRTFQLMVNLLLPQLAIYEVVLRGSIKSYCSSFSTTNNVMDAQIISEKVVTQGLIDLRNIARVLWMIFMPTEPLKSFICIKLVIG